MAKESSQQPLTHMNRRQMLTAGTAVLGGAIAGVGGNVFAQEKSHAASAGAPAANPNLAPPVVQVKGGKLRGLREGRTTSFLGIRYAEADRFELARPG